MADYGILGPVQQMASWQQPVGILGAALKDAGAYLSGHPADANSVMQYGLLTQQNQARQAAQQAIGQAQSSDPASRQAAYATLRGMGIDTTPFERAAASQALPQLLQSMQPSMGFNDNPVAVTPAVNATGPDVAAQRQAAQSINAAPAISMQPGLSLPQAIAKSSPELQAEFAPQLIQNAINMQSRQILPATAEQKAAVGLSKNTPAQYEVGTGRVIPIDDPGKNNPNQPFNADGTPNKAYQDWTLRKARAGGEVSSAAGWQLLVDPKTNTPYRYNVRTGQALDFSGNPYTPNGASHVASGQVRSPASLAVQKFVEEHPNATAQDIAQFSADFSSTGKAVGAFSTGKQGDLIRSFNVGISHLNTLDGLVDALGNGDTQALNKFGNAVAQQTGNPAPTNFDAAKAIVGDEIIKAIVGGGGALADRENAQNQIDRANSPQQLRGVIKTYKELMAGQLEGLKKQYSDTTHRNNFDSRLSSEAQTELERKSNSPQPVKFPPSQSKTLNGVTYHLVNGQWMSE